MRMHESRMRQIPGNSTTIQRIQIQVGALLTSFILCAGLGAQSAAQQASIGAPIAAESPAHPVTEATLRRYFEACHFDVRNREALEVEFEAQRLTLPAWYPRKTW